MKKMVSYVWYGDDGECNGGGGYAEPVEVVELTDSTIERIAEAVARKLTVPHYGVAEEELEDRS